MHAQAKSVDPDRPKFWCENHNEIMDGQVEMVEGYDVERAYNHSPDDYASMADLSRWTVPLAVAPCGHHEHENDYPEDLLNLSEIWFCTNCDAEYPNATLAGECCQ